MIGEKVLSAFSAVVPVHLYHLEKFDLPNSQSGKSMVIFTKKTAAT